MDSLKIGVMGCAKIARRSVIPAILESGVFQLDSVASRTRSKAESLAAEFSCEAVEGYEALLQRDIDAVYMPLPTGLHEEWVMKALEAGKHVLAEKSLAMNGESAQRMVDRAREGNLLLMENFMFLYHSQHQFVKNVLAGGGIGEIRTFRSSFGFPPLEKGNFRYDAPLGGGALLDAAAYTLRAACFLLGDGLEVSAASMGCDESIGVDIFGGAFVQGSGSRHAELAWGFDNVYQCNYEIWGSEGLLTAHRAFTPGPGFSPLVTIQRHREVERHELEADNHFVGLLTEFARCVADGDCAPKWEELLVQSRMLDEVRQAARRAAG